MSSLALSPQLTEYSSAQNRCPLFLGNPYTASVRVPPQVYRRPAGERPYAEGHACFEHVMLKVAAKGKGEKGEQATENKTKRVFSFNMFNRLCNLQTPQANAKLRLQEEYKNVLLKDEKRQ